MSIADHEPTIEGYCGETDITLGCSCGWAQPWWNYRTQKLDGPTWIEHVQADSLDAAWAEAEAALPEPGHIALGGPYSHPGYEGQWGASAFLDRQSPLVTGRLSEPGFAGAVGPSGPAALRALAAKLREAQG